jgi:hypothetical protein
MWTGCMGVGFKSISRIKQGSGWWLFLLNLLTRFIVRQVGKE